MNDFMALRANTDGTETTHTKIVGWLYMSNWQDVLVLIGWIFTAINPPKDLVYYHLNRIREKSQILAQQ